MSITHILLQDEILPEEIQLCVGSQDKVKVAVMSPKFRKCRVIVPFLSFSLSEYSICIGKGKEGNAPYPLL